MTPATPPVSAAAEQQHQHNDYQDQFHGKSPLMVFDGVGIICRAPTVYSGVMEAAMICSR
jgi:hypothetical protein